MQARPRNLPRRQATPANLLPGYVRPAQQVQQNQAPKVIRKSNKTRRQTRNPLPRRRYSERTVHIMNESGLLRTFERPDNDAFASNCVSETRAKICGEIHDRLIWRASRKAIIKLWVRINITNAQNLTIFLDHQTRFLKSDFPQVQRRRLALDNYKAKK